ncbi:RNA polymerase sigma factor [Brachyspira sp.]|uniref:RNA polymerase sigma factor n=1 Tax=Brachyspira sp. TaxID=1977261 RepID=UPI0026057D06|nr:RNA polymerase sigma factor [Brachyspira sp.]
MSSIMAYEENTDSFKIGNEEAYKELIEMYKKPLFNLVYSMISNRDEAEEIVQDVFVSFYIKRESFEGRSKIYTWLYRVSFNRAVDHIRKKEREKKYRLKEYRNSQMQESDNDNSIHKIILADALSKLKDDFRIPLMMAEYENYSYSEISEKLDLPVNTVRTRIFRARKKLLHIMKKIGVSL